MTNWAEIRHCYGAAEDIPALLAALTPNIADETWHELWSRVCHQGSVYAASAAVLPELLALARAWTPADRVAPLTLAGAIVSSSDPSPDFDIAPFRADIDALALLAIETITAARWSQIDLIHLLQAAAGLQGHSLWGNQLDRLGDGEYFHGVCPACEAELETELGIAPGHLRLEGSRSHTTISPIDVKDLDGIGLQLHELASKAGHPEVARRLRDVFGQAPCPACGERIAVDEAIAIADA